MLYLGSAVLSLLFLRVFRSQSAKPSWCVPVFTWTMVLKVSHPPIPTVLCIIWTWLHPRVTTCVPVLKTTRFPCSNWQCCHIRVFHPYLSGRSPPLIVWRYGLRAASVMHWRPSMAKSVPVTGLWWAICYPSLTCLIYETFVLPVAFNSHEFSSKDVSPFPPVIRLRWTWEYFSYISAAETGETATTQTMLLCLQSLASSRLSLVCIPKKMIPHLWVVKRPVSRWSAMAASSSLEASWRAAKIGSYHTQTLLRDFLLPENTSTLIIKINENLISLLYFLLFLCIHYQRSKLISSLTSPHLNLLYKCSRNDPYTDNMLLCFVLPQRLSSQYAVCIPTVPDDTHD